MKIAQRCPVCLGSGNVPGGFYNVCAGRAGIAVFPGEMTSWSSTSALEKCRSCVDGLVYVEQEVEQEVKVCEHMMTDSNRVIGRKVCVLCGYIGDKII